MAASAAPAVVVRSSATRAAIALLRGFRSVVFMGGVPFLRSATTIRPSLGAAMVNGASRMEAPHLDPEHALCRQELAVKSLEPRRMETTKRRVPCNSCLAGI